MVSKVAWYQTFQSLSAGCVLCTAGKSKIGSSKLEVVKRPATQAMLDWRWERPTTMMIDFEAGCLNKAWSKLVK